MRVNPAPDRVCVDLTCSMATITTADICIVDNVVNTIGPRAQCLVRLAK
jgi:hypothetical protein